MAKRFSVWLGTTIDPAYGSVADIQGAVRALRPPGSWSLEALWKGGEGGSWQSQFDPHPLAISGPDRLAELRAAGTKLSPKLTVTPYIVLRGRPAWNDAEWAQIAACAEVAGRVVLNLEEGPAYWNGPTDAEALTREYILPLKARLPEKASLELCCIPRQWVIDALGGRDCLIAWAYACQSASWEAYDAVAPDLDVAASMGRVMSWLEPTDRMWKPRYYTPLVQRSRIDAWAQTGYCKHGMQVWWIDGD